MLLKMTCLWHPSAWLSARLWQSFLFLRHCWLHLHLLLGLQGDSIFAKEEEEVQSFNSETKCCEKREVPEKEG